MDLADRDSRRPRDSPPSWMWAPIPSTASRPTRRCWRPACARWSGFEPQAACAGEAGTDEGPARTLSTLRLGRRNPAHPACLRAGGHDQPAGSRPCASGAFQFVSYMGTSESPASPSPPESWTTSPRSPHMDFLKMDVQGGERDVLAHGRSQAEGRGGDPDRSFLCSPLQGPAALRRNGPDLAGTGFPAPLRHRHQDLAAGAHGVWATSPTGASASCWKPTWSMCAISPAPKI